MHRLIRTQIEGLITVVIAIAFMTFFPSSTSRPSSVLRLRYFSERDAQIMTARVLRDDPSKSHTKTHVSREELMTAVSVYVHKEAVTSMMER